VAVIVRTVNDHTQRHTRAAVALYGQGGVVQPPVFNNKAGYLLIALVIFNGKNVAARISAGRPRAEFPSIARRTRLCSKSDSYQFPSLFVPA
jgi:hypothetical protein